MITTQPFLPIPDELTDDRNGAASRFLRNLHAVLSEVAGKPGLEQFFGFVRSGIAAQSQIGRDFDDRVPRSWPRIHGVTWNVAELRVTADQGRRSGSVMLFSDDFRDGGRGLRVKLSGLCQADPEIGARLSVALTQALGVEVSHTG